MTENKRFERIYEDVDVFCIDHNKKGISQLIEKEDYDKIVDLLNELHEEKEDWKSNCLTTLSENSILWNEISVLREQGAEPSDAFKNYLNNLKNKNKKLQGD